MKYKLKIIYFIIASLISAVILALIIPRGTASEATQDRFWSEKVTVGSKFNMLVYGDSRAYRGVSVEHVLKGNVKKGFSGYNLAFSSAGMNAAMYKFLEGKLTQDKSEKRIIVLGVTANSLTPQSGINEHYQQEADRGGFEKWKNIYFEPVLSWTDPIKPYDLFSSLRGKGSDNWEIYHRDGWVESYYTGTDTTYALKIYRKNFEENEVDKELVRGLFKQVGLWTAKGIEVYGFFPPVPEPMQKIEREFGFNPEEIITGFQNAGAQWIDIDPASYKSYDSSHLDGYNAIKLSAELGKKIFEN